MTLLIIIILLVLLFLFYLTQHDTVKTFSLVLFIVVFAVGAAYVYVRITSSKVKLARRLESMGKHLIHGDLDFLKKEYKRM